MLPNETILETFRWFDRRFLETRLRCVSRRADALVQLLAKRPPRLGLRELILIGGDDFIEFRVTFERPATVVEEPLERRRKPFDVFDPSLFPPYLFFRKVSIGPSANKPTVDMLTDSMVTVKSSNSMDFFVRGPPGKEPLAAVLDYSWVNCARFTSGPIKCSIIAGSHLYRSTDFLTVRLLDPESTVMLANWLVTPVEPSARNPQPRLRLKHCGVLSSTASDFEKFLRLLCEHFTDATCPSGYHVYMPNMADTTLDAGARRRHNLRSQEVLTNRLSDDGTVAQIWRQRVDSPFDDCDGCGRKYQK